MFLRTKLQRSVFVRLLKLFSSFLLIKTTFSAVLSKGLLYLPLLQKGENVVEVLHLVNTHPTLLLPLHGVKAKKEKERKEKSEHTASKRCDSGKGGGGGVINKTTCRTMKMNEIVPTGRIVFFCGL